jgi:Putative heavy-metal-binding
LIPRSARIFRWGSGISGGKVSLINEARARGGNAIVAMRFDTTELGDVWTEICAYGTAVQAVPVTEAAKYTASQLGYGAGS